MTDKYILNAAGEPEPCDDLFTWGRWMQNGSRVVKQEQVNGAKVSTVFLGLDHRWTPEMKPELFETMVFGGNHADHQERYATRDEAVAGHERIVAMVRDTTCP